MWEWVNASAKRIDPSHPVQSPQADLGQNILHLCKFSAIQRTSVALDFNGC